MGRKSGVTALPLSGDLEFIGGAVGVEDLAGAFLKTFDPTSRMFTYQDESGDEQTATLPHDQFQGTGHTRVFPGASGGTATALTLTSPSGEELTEYDSLYVAFRSGRDVDAGATIKIDNLDAVGLRMKNGDNIVSGAISRGDWVLAFYNDGSSTFDCLVDPTSLTEALRRIQTNADNIAQNSETASNNRLGLADTTSRLESALRSISTLDNLTVDIHRSTTQQWIPATVNDWAVGLGETGTSAAGEVPTIQFSQNISVNVEGYEIIVRRRRSNSIVLRDYDILIDRPDGVDPTIRGDSNHYVQFAQDATHTYLRLLGYGNFGDDVYARYHGVDPHSVWGGHYDQELFLAQFLVALQTVRRTSVREVDQSDNSLVTERAIAVAIAAIDNSGTPGALQDNSIEPIKAKAGTAAEKKAWRERFDSAHISAGTSLLALAETNLGDIRVITQNIASGVSFVDISDPATVLTSASAGDVMMVVMFRTKVWARVGNILDSPRLSAVEDLVDAMQGDLIVSPAEWVINFEARVIVINYTPPSRLIGETGAVITATIGGRNFRLASNATLSGSLGFDVDINATDAREFSQNTSNLRILVSVSKNSVEIDRVLADFKKVDPPSSSSTPQPRLKALLLGLHSDSNVEITNTAHTLKFREIPGSVESTGMTLSADGLSVGLADGYYRLSGYVSGVVSGSQNAAISLSANMPTLRVASATSVIIAAPQKPRIQTHPTCLLYTSPSPRDS